MKKIATSLFLVLAIHMPTWTLQAIPNQIGNVGFVNPAGMRFENFAGEAKTWKANVKLPGNWENWSDPKNQDSHILVYRLDMPADVFGIRASQVTAQLKNDKVLQFKIVFEKSSSQSASLIDQLTTNIQSFTGESGGTNKNSFRYKKINIQLKGGSNGAVVVTISPQAKAVVLR